jgi:flagellar FliL protein
VAKGATSSKGEKINDGASEGGEPSEAPRKKSRAKLFVILAVVLVLLGGGGAGAFFMLRKPPATEAAAAPADAAKPEANGIVTFEPFIVNLADPGKRRFLRINVRLLVGEAEEAEHIQKSEVLQMRLRADILELLTEQTSESVTTAEGKAELKKTIAERAHHILEKTEIADVLFSDFVVQY